MDNICISFLCCPPVNEGVIGGLLLCGQKRNNRMKLFAAVNYGSGMDSVCLEFTIQLPWDALRGRACGLRIVVECVHGPVTALRSLPALMIDGPDHLDLLPCDDQGTARTG